MERLQQSGQAAESTYSNSKQLIPNSPAGGGVQTPDLYADNTWMTRSGRADAQVGSQSQK